MKKIGTFLINNKNYDIIESVDSINSLHENRKVTILSKEELFDIYASSFYLRVELSDNSINVCLYYGSKLIKCWKLSDTQTTTPEFEYCIDLGAGKICIKGRVSLDINNREACFLGEICFDPIIGGEKCEGKKLCTKF